MIWFSSDWHFGHSRIIELCDRPYATVDQMNNDIIARINDTVGKYDELWCVGDMCMGTISETLPLISRIKCVVNLVPGNHDRVSKSYSNKSTYRDKFVRRYAEAGVILREEYIKNFSIHGIPFDICHFPFIGDSQSTDRYNSFRPADRGQWLVHGHVHEQWRQRDRQINVGIDAFGAPVSIDQIYAMIFAGPASLDAIGLSQ